MNCYCKVLYIPEIFIYTSLYSPLACGSNDSPTSEVCPSAMLILLVVENLNVKFSGSTHWHNIRTRFHWNPSRHCRFKSCGQTDTISIVCFEFMHIVQRTYSNESRTADKRGLQLWVNLKTNNISLAMSQSLMERFMWLKIDAAGVLLRRSL
jgi:hypothetical protein